MPDSGTKKHVSTVIRSVNSNSLPSVRNSGTTPAIHNSWKRCFNDYSIDPSSRNQPRIITGSELRECQEPLEEFLFIAKSGMQSLYEKIASAGYVILLGDANGVTIDYLGNPHNAREHREAGLYLGSLWAESVEGTCGVGTCIEEKRPITIHRDEHFRARHIGLSCSTTPLFFPDGSLLGVLDISLLNPPESRDSQLLALQMLSYSARMIENAYFMRLYKDYWIVRFNCMKAFVEVVAESFLAVNNEGYVIAANQSALTQLRGPQLPSPIGRHINSIFDLRLEELVEHATHKTTTILPIRCLDSGNQYFATFRAPEQKPLAPLPKKDVRSKPAAHFTLDYLAGTDPRMCYNVNCAKRLMNKNISILLIGETGTGKEVFARAIHEASERASKPFVALNCASIPESLIESELFGYKQGAFTGANSKGMRGKILQSSGGTLFLDEIGDMPFNLQTRLLRVLAEREVQPLGSESVIKVDLNIICATLRNLEELVREKQFREDLYYRLNGITIKLPPLRQRADRALVIENALAAESDPDAGIRLSPEALETLAACDWPGNIRQLRNVLRFAIAISEGEVIGVKDLPPDLFGSPPPRAAAPESLLLPATPLPAAEPEAELPNLSTRDARERERLHGILRKNKWNITDASRELCISRSTLYRKMSRYQLIPPNEL